MELFCVLCCDWAFQISLQAGTGVTSSDPPGWHTLVLWSMHGRSEAILRLSYLFGRFLCGSALPRWGHAQRNQHQGTLIVILACLSVLTPTHQ